MSDRLTPSPFMHPAPGGCAEVRVGGHVMRYLRRGTGSPVVVLDDPAASGWLWPELIDVLASRTRTILPEPPGPDIDFVSWMRGFLEGIGACEAAVVAAGPFCLPALELALLGPGVLSRLVLVPDGSAEETGLTGALEGSGTGNGSRLPILVVRRQHPAPDSLALIERFLLG